MQLVMAPSQPLPQSDLAKIDINALNAISSIKYERFAPASQV